MRRLVFLLVCLVCLGCGPTTPTQPPPAPVVYLVRWTTLVRDFQMAESYAGYTVRVRLDRDDYTVEGGEIHCYQFDNGTPPILVFRGAPNLPTKPYPPITVVGVCQHPVRDGRWRSRTADFSLVIEQCVITER